MTSAHFTLGTRTYRIVPTRDVVRVYDRAHAERIVSELRSADPHQYDAMLRELDLADRALGQPEDADQRLVDAIARGHIVVVRHRDTPRLLDAPRDEPLVPKKPGPTGPTIERPTWISLEVVAEDGIHLPGLSLSLECPNGALRSGRLDGESSWRADDVPTRGACTLKLAPIAIDWNNRTFGPPATGVWIDAHRREPIELRTESHHRLVAVGGRTEIQILDATRTPMEGVRCTVTASGRDLQGNTDDEGVFVAIHPRSADECTVTLTQLDASAVRPDDGTRPPPPSESVPQPSIVSPLNAYAVARTREGSEAFNRLELAPPFVFSA